MNFPFIPLGSKVYPDFLHPRNLGSQSMFERQSVNPDPTGIIKASAILS